MKGLFGMGKKSKKNTKKGKNSGTQSRSVSPPPPPRKEEAASAPAPAPQPAPVQTPIEAAGAAPVSSPPPPPSLASAVEKKLEEVDVDNVPQPAVPAPSPVPVPVPATTDTTASIAPALAPSSEAPEAHVVSEAAVSPAPPTSVSVPLPGQPGSQADTSPEATPVANSTSTPTPVAAPSPTVNMGDARVTFEHLDLIEKYGSCSSSGAGTQTAVADMHAELKMVEGNLRTLAPSDYSATFNPLKKAIWFQEKGNFAPGNEQHWTMCKVHRTVKNGASNLATNLPLADIEGLPGDTTADSLKKLGNKFSSEIHNIAFFEVLEALYELVELDSTTAMATDRHDQLFQRVASFVKIGSRQCFESADPLGSFLGESLPPPPRFGFQMILDIFAKLQKVGPRADPTSFDWDSMGVAAPDGIAVWQSIASMKRQSLSPDVWWKVLFVLVLDLEPHLLRMNLHLIDKTEIASFQDFLDEAMEPPDQNKSSFYKSMISQVMQFQKVLLMTKPPRQSTELLSTLDRVFMSGENTLYKPEILTEVKALPIPAPSPSPSPAPVPVASPLEAVASAPQAPAPEPTPIPAEMPAPSPAPMSTPIPSAEPVIEGQAAAPPKAVPPPATEFNVPMEITVSRQNSTRMSVLDPNYHDTMTIKETLPSPRPSPVPAPIAEPETVEDVPMAVASAAPTPVPVPAPAPAPAPQPPQGLAPRDAVPSLSPSPPPDPLKIALPPVPAPPKSISPQKPGPMPKSPVRNQLTNNSTTLNTTPSEDSGTLTGNGTQSNQEDALMNLMQQASSVVDAISAEKHELITKERRMARNLQSAEDNLKALQAVNEGLLRENASQKDEIYQREDDIGKLEAAAKQSAQDLADLQSYNQQLLAHIEELNAHIQGLNAEKEVVESALVDVKNEKSELEENLASSQQDGQSLREQLDAEKAARASLEDDLATNKHDKETLEGQLRATSELLDDANEEIDRLEEIQAEQERKEAEKRKEQMEARRRELERAEQEAMESLKRAEEMRKAKAEARANRRARSSAASIGPDSVGPL